MNAEQLQHWKEQLLAERVRLERELDGLKQTTGATAMDQSGDLSSHSSHMADAGTDTMEREKAFLLTGQKSQRLEEVVEALVRIKKGTFGVCEVCNGPIPERRLERMPTASMCVPCKEQSEKKRR